MGSKRHELLCFALRRGDLGLPHSLEKAPGARLEGLLTARSAYVNLLLSRVNVGGGALSGVKIPLFALYLFDIKKKQKEREGDLTECSERLELQELWLLSGESQNGRRFDGSRELHAVYRSRCSWSSWRAQSSEPVFVMYRPPSASPLMS